MTLENAKRLYEFYVANGMEDRALDIAKQRPEVLPPPKPKKKAAKKRKS